MNKEEMMELKSGDVIVIKYANEELPVIQVVKQSATEDYPYIDFEAGCRRAASNGLQMIKIGHVTKVFEFN